MKIESNAPCSDLGTAREISRRLRGVSERHQRPDAARPGYSSFSLARAAKAEDTATNGTRSWGSDRWNELLDLCLQVSGAESAYLTDERGLVLTLRGPISDDRVELLGARLSIAIEQAGRLLEDPAQPVTVAIEINDAWMTGISVKSPDATALMVALLGKAPISGSERNDIVRLVMDALRT